MGTRQQHLCSHLLGIGPRPALFACSASLKPHCPEVPRTSDISTDPSPGILSPLCSLNLRNPARWSGCPAPFLVEAFLSLRSLAAGSPKCPSPLQPSQRCSASLCALSPLARSTDSFPVRTQRKPLGLSHKELLLGFLQISPVKLTLETQELTLTVILIRHHLVGLLSCKKAFES